jgi:hypothetical protein
VWQMPAGSNHNYVGIIIFYIFLNHIFDNNLEDEVFFDSLNVHYNNDLN